MVMKGTKIGIVRKIEAFHYYSLKDDEAFALSHEDQGFRSTNIQINNVKV